MFKRPSSRRRSSQEPVALNLVPVLDTLVTLIAFLLFTMSFLNVVHIESPFPTASPKDVEEKLKEKPLQLTVTLREGELELWSPFDLIPAQKIPNPETGKFDLRRLHEALITVKQKFPTENKLVLVPYAGATYDVLVSVMDSIRVLEPSDPPVFIKNPKSGIDEVSKLLFPEVIFGNLLGDT